VYVSYKGEPIDSNGLIPDPWDIESFPDNSFSESKQIVKIPHTENYMVRV
jgi:hypothetical protein